SGGLEATDAGDSGSPAATPDTSAAAVAAAALVDAGAAGYGYPTSEAQLLDGVLDRLAYIASLPRAPEVVSAAATAAMSAQGSIPTGDGHPAGAAAVAAHASATTGGGMVADSFSVGLAAAMPAPCLPTLGEGSSAVQAHAHAAGALAALLTLSASAKAAY